MWGFRLMKEGERSRSSFFVTLTYNTAYVPITKNGFMTLGKKPAPFVNKKGKLVKNTSDDLQLFFKRLRKSHSKQKHGKLYPVRYYACGEYGDNNSRPHYHLIIFNASQEDILNAWVNPESKKAIGTIYFGEVTGASIAYSLKYISKQKRIPLHARDDRRKEFAYMSKGIGSNYLTQQMIRWHLNDIKGRYYVPGKGGSKFPMPRYYRERIYDSETFGMLKGELEQLADIRQKEFERIHGSNWAYVLSEKHRAMWRNMYRKNIKSSF